MINYSKLYYLILLLLCALSVSARQPQLDRVAQALKKGEIENAQKYIDKAITQKAFSNNTRAWFEYGRVYQAIARGEGNPKVLMDSEAAMSESLLGFRKAVAISVVTN